MRSHCKTLCAIGLPIFLSMMLATATTSFGQINLVPALEDKPAASATPATPVKPLAQQRALIAEIKQTAEQQKSRWQELLRNVLDLAINVLSGNKTNVLWGNSPEVCSNNEAEFLSGNKPKILSENKTPILSNNRCSLSILSNIKIEIHIQNSGNNNSNPAPPPHANPAKSIQVTPMVHPTPIEPTLVPQ